MGAGFGFRCAGGELRVAPRVALLAEGPARALTGRQDALLVGSRSLSDGALEEGLPGSLSGLFQNYAVNSSGELSCLKKE